MGEDSKTTPTSNTALLLNSKHFLLHFAKRNKNIAGGGIALPLCSGLTARGKKSDWVSLFGDNLVAIVHSHQKVMQLTQLTHLLPLVVDYHELCHRVNGQYNDICDTLAWKTQEF